MNLLVFKHLWLLAVFQGINVVLFLVEVIFYVSPSIWLVFAFAFWEGLVDGAAYVNTYYRISEEIPQARKMFALSITGISDSTGIALVGKYIKAFLSKFIIIWILQDTCQCQYTMLFVNYRHHLG